MTNDQNDVFGMESFLELAQKEFVKLSEEKNICWRCRHLAKMGDYIAKACIAHGGENLIRYQELEQRIPVRMMLEDPQNDLGKMRRCDFYLTIEQLQQLRDYLSLHENNKICRAKYSCYQQIIEIAERELVEILEKVKSEIEN